MRKYTKTSNRTVEIEIESYVTLRKDWPNELKYMVNSKFNARGFRVVGGHAEWQYFATEKEAKEWADAVHEIKPLVI